MLHLAVLYVVLQSQAWHGSFDREVMGCVAEGCTTECGMTCKVCTSQEERYYDAAELQDQLQVLTMARSVVFIVDMHQSV
jgi:hypothetical protein